ncbi:MAG: hypothetical protein FWB75_08940 [Oscillospiraceae bacterium]|nr:hypothetical protein [Oscillospiraceae bacterium]
MTWRKVLKGMLVTVAMLVFVVVLSDGVVASAAERAPYPPFRVESQDGSRVFIYNWRHRFPRAGVYYNTNPPQLIYSVAISIWSLPEDNFFISEDFNHIAIVHPDSSTAVSFYSYGVLQASYLVSDLVRNSHSIITIQVGAGAAGFFTIWEEYQRRSFNVDTGRLRITTRDGLTYIFDIYTASITAGPIPGIPPRYRPFAGLMLFSLICTGIGRKIHSRKAENTQGYKGKPPARVEHCYHWRF